MRTSAVPYIKRFLLLLLAAQFYQSALAQVVRAQSTASEHAVAAPIRQINKDFLGSHFIIEGEVTSVVPPSKGGRPYKVWLNDGTAAASVVIWPATWDKLPFLEKIVPGARLRAEVVVVNNSNTIEANVAGPAHVALGAPLGLKETVMAARNDKTSSVALLTGGAFALLATTALFLLLRARRNLKKCTAYSALARRELEQGVARFNHLMTASSSVIYTLRPSNEDGDRSYSATFYSDNLEKMLGYSPENVVRKQEWWAENVHPEDRPKAVAEQAELFKKDVLDRNYRFQNRMGQYRVLHDQQRLLRDALGKPYEIIGALLDVTDLRKSDELKHMFASLGERLGAAETPRQVAQIVLDAADELLGWDFALVSLYDEDDRRMRNLLFYDEVEGRRREIKTRAEGYALSPLGDKVLGDGAKIILRGKNFTDVEGLSLAGSDRRSGSLLFAPLRKKGQGIGIVSIQSYAFNAYRNEDMETLQVLADYCGTALARTFAEQNRKTAEEALRESEDRYALALRGANDGLWDWNLKTNTVYFSPRWRSMLGLNEDELGDTPSAWESRIHPDDQAGVKAALTAHIQGAVDQLEVECRIMHKDGSYRWMLVRGVAVCDAEGNAYRMAGSQTDITERKLAEEQLEHGAYYDALTRLPNRLLFTDELKRAISRSRRHPEKLFAVLFLDLDRFKIINDSLGHNAGDQVLVEVATRLKTCVRPEDMVARLGGDEFTILLEEISDAGEVSCIAERIQNELGQPIVFGGHKTYSTASIGIAFSNDRYEEAEDILRDADAAMYRAKAKGKARFELFDAEMHENAMELLSLDGDLRRAVESNEFEVYYQPQVSLPNGRIIGFEALIRWNHPTRGFLMPADFIAQAEENDVIIKMGMWVLEESCRQLREWRRMFPQDPPLTVSVNVCRRQFSQAGFVEAVAQVLESTGLDSAALVLEITETSLMENAEWLMSLLDQLKASGVRLHIDDFGTGYSSLGYLHRFPVDKLKIDRSFINKMSADGGDFRIVQAIIGLAKNLGIGVIAEGIETEKQLELLASIECLCGQGFLFHKPMTTEKITEILGNSKPR